LNLIQNSDLNSNLKWKSKTEKKTKKGKLIWAMTLTFGPSLLHSLL
jgi:hypothetical protein